MTTQEVANQYYHLATQNKWQDIVALFYHDDIVNQEPPNSKHAGETRGLTAVREKAARFQNSIQKMHSAYLTPPLVAGNLFAIGMGQDNTYKEDGRSKFDEFCIFTVRNGKIVREEFVMQWNEGRGHSYQDSVLETVREERV